MKIRIISIIVGCLILIGCNASNSEAEKAGAQAAEQWLSIVDSGEYAQSWVESAAFFQANVSQTEWVKKLENVRQSFGASLDRSRAKAEYSSTLPGAPDAEYVVVKFEASFEQKAIAIETVTVVMSDEGRWKVIGYFIK